MASRDDLDEDAEDREESRRVMTLAWERDLRRVCVHECAHVHVAKRFGLSGKLEITEDPTLGLFHFFTGKADIQSAEPRQRRLIALAGTCAEFLLRNPKESAELIHNRLASGERVLSPTDADLAGEYTIEDVAESLAMVRTLWDDIIEDAERHIASRKAEEERRVSGGGNV